MIEAKGPDVFTPSVNLEEIEADCWSRLQQATTTSHSEFHLAVAATTSDQVPSLRTVVLRRVWMDEKKLAFHTDLRSPKVAELMANPAIALLFYSKTDRLQLRISGTASIDHDGPDAWLAWNNSRGFSRRCYLSDAAPGTAADHPAIGFPEVFAHREPNREETEPARAHFAVVIIQVQQMEWLWLHHAGHRRARFRYSLSGIESGWLVP